eukprot:COSAG06_NODE_3422_length_5370_cov_2.834187_2_plen_607_part_00
MRKGSFLTHHVLVDLALLFCANGTTGYDSTTRDNEPPVVGGSAPPAPEHLRCEHAAPPLIGLDVPRPRLSWTVPSSSTSTAVFGEMVSAYEVSVLDKTHGGRKIFESGRQAARPGQGLSTVYSGQALAADTSFIWRVRVWTTSSTAASPWSEPYQFHTAPAQTAWRNASWIDGSQGAVRKQILLPTGAVIQEAYVYASSIAFHEILVNGALVGNQSTYLYEPGQSSYTVRSLFTSYNVTALLNTKSGFTVGVRLGNGPCSICAGTSVCTKAGTHPCTDFIDSSPGDATCCKRGVQNSRALRLLVTVRYFHNGVLRYLVVPTADGGEMLAPASSSTPACTNKPQPCPAHAGRTFCPSLQMPHQCDQPMPHKPCPPCPSPSPPSPPTAVSWATTSSENVKDDLYSGEVWDNRIGANLTANGFWSFGPVPTGIPSASALHDGRGINHSATMSAQLLPPISVSRSYPAVSVSRVRGFGNNSAAVGWVFKFNQSMAGRATLRVQHSDFAQLPARCQWWEYKLNVSGSGHQQTRVIEPDLQTVVGPYGCVSLRYGNVLEDDGTVMNQFGNITYDQSDVFILGPDHGEQKYTPHFTYHVRPPQLSTTFSWTHV